MVKTPGGTGHIANADNAVIRLNVASRDRKTQPQP